MAGMEGPQCSLVSFLDGNAERYEGFTSFCNSGSGAGGSSGLQPMPCSRQQNSRFGDDQPLSKGTGKEASKPI